MMPDSGVLKDCDLPIGIFDSGVGGLTVFKAVKTLLPNENITYLGDTARVPYGTKSASTITRYTLMVAGELARRGIKMLVVACNTATSAALPELRKQLAPIPVVGVIEPGAAAAVQATKNGQIMVIATEATINGNAYQRAIVDILPGAQIIARACTLFVSLAEEGWGNDPIAESVAVRYLGDIFHAQREKPDTLLLGCTHFPLLFDALTKVVGSGVRIVDSASATAQKVNAVLAELKLHRTTASSPEHIYITTDNRDRFARAGSLFLGEELEPSQIELVDL